MLFYSEALIDTADTSKLSKKRIVHEYLVGKVLSRVDVI